MFVWEQGVFMPADADAMAGFEALDEVLLHFAAEMPDRLATMIGHQLDSGDVLGAATGLASFAARRELLVSNNDRRTLREAIEAYRGDTGCVDQLDRRAGVRTSAPPQIPPAAATRVMPAVPPQVAPPRSGSRQPVRRDHATGRPTVPMPAHRPELRVDPAAQTIMMPAIR
ncbi:hypothetical protein LZ318_03710 [Saccharopolyspora indica]|uniref:hypothetical protein n=1 Tax=Saccharopolyspora indica TaxID=1229659 RepID=UPI0022EB3107|nr:hypothetical protein [Saccharopolyspora indica]MDA3644966.1 hypothetical protein [Saccharopolyspora indica]